MSEAVTTHEPVLRAEKLSKTYAVRANDGRRHVELFENLDFSLASGELVAVVGASGAGKSSLLHLLAALDRPSSGEVWYGDRPLSSMSDGERSGLRNREIGYVWQFHYLLPEFTALENVALPLASRGTALRSAEGQASRWLDAVGLADRAKHRSGELSGGEQQRVSLARALVTGPKILMADEPTGDLDEVTAEAVFSLLQRLHVQNNLASILVTHNLQFAERCDRALVLHRGRLEPLDRRGR